MYDVTVTYSGTAIQVDQTAARNTALHGVRVEPVLQAGQTYEEAMAGLEVQYLYNGSATNTAGSTQQNPAFIGYSNLLITDGSARRLVNASTMKIVAGVSGQSFIFHFLESAGENFYPDDAAVAAADGGGGGGNNPNLVVETTQAVVPGYVPSPSSIPMDGASITGAKGVRLYFSFVGGDIANPVPNTASLLCYRQVAIGGVGGNWIRVPDLDIPLNANAAGLQGIGLPDQKFDVGTAGERIIWVPNAACAGAGVTEAALVIEIQS